MTAFFAPESWPFLFAIGALIALVVLEGLTLMVGHSASHWLDGAIPHMDGVEGFANTVLGWLHVGKVPILALIVTFLTAFSVIGYGIQIVAGAIVGHFVPAFLASIAAFAGSIPVVRFMGAVLARLLPKDETSAVSDATLVGRVAVVMTGTATAGRPAQARLYDEHRNTHYVMVEPEDGDITLGSGASVLLVRQLAGRRFQAIPNPKPELL